VTQPPRNGVAELSRTRERLAHATATVCRHQARQARSPDRGGSFSDARHSNPPRRYG
jgi:hypothetical protein